MCGSGLTDRIDPSDQSRDPVSVRISVRVFGSGRIADRELGVHERRMKDLLVLSRRDHRGIIDVLKTMPQPLRRTRFIAIGILNLDGLRLTLLSLTKEGSVMHVDHDHHLHMITSEQKLG